MKKQINLLIMSILTIFVSVLMTGCGGGGGGGTTGGGGAPATVSGVAAGGAPVIGLVYLKDSSNPNRTLGPQKINLDGSFSFDVTGLTAPFYLMAEGAVAGRGYRFVSATTGAGTANLNPLSTLAVASAARVANPANVFNNPGGYPITQANLDSAVADIQRMLKPILDAYNANINPITGAFSANHTGLDAVLDVVSVSIDPAGNVSVGNKIQGTTFTTATTTTLGSAAPVTQAQIPSNQAITDLQAIANMLSNLAAVMNKPRTALDLDPFFATGYGIENGLTRAQVINDWVLNGPDFPITAITNLTIIKQDAATGDYYIDGIVKKQDGSFERLALISGGFILHNENGAWKLRGNGYKSSIGHDPAPATFRWLNANGTTQTESGLYMWFEDKGNYGIQTATVTGPGLPPKGVTLTQQGGSPILLHLDPAFRSNIPTDQDWFYVIDDATLSAIPDNSVYTLQFFNINMALIETRTVTLPKAAFTRSLVNSNAGYLPGLSGITGHSIATDAHIGGTLQITYARPTAYVTSRMSAELWFWDGVNSADYSNSLPLNNTTGGILSATPAWTPRSGNLQLSAKDDFGRGVVLSWQFQ